MPVAVSGGLSFTHVATADAVVYGLQANGSVWSWGEHSRSVHCLMRCRAIDAVLLAAGCWLLAAGCWL